MTGDGQGQRQRFLVDRFMAASPMLAADRANVALSDCETCIMVATLRCHGVRFKVQ